MNILVIGSNGREHALAVAYAKSKKVKRVIMTPGNGLSDHKNKKIKNYPDIGMMDFDKIVAVCKKEKIDLVDVAQDDVIAAGYVDRLEKMGISAFGPSQAAAQIEWDKEWSRELMKKYNLPIPEYKVFTEKKTAIAYITAKKDCLLFIKAAGLALGKGVLKATNKEEAILAIDAMKQFGKAGETFLIEEGLVGEEFTVFAICDGNNYVIAKNAQDHKTIWNGDRGPNTGGVGCVAPTNVVTPKVLALVEKTIIKPLLKGLKKEQRPYSGILYVGGILTKKGPKIIEFNSRWGDPEAEVILPSIKTDYLAIVTAVKQKRLSKQKILFDKKVRVGVAACAQGYPTDYSATKGKEIFGIQKIEKLTDISIYGSGIKRIGNRFFANGGRLFYIIAEGKNIIDARQKAYDAMSLLHIEGNSLHYRTDIGWRDVERMYIQ